MSLPTRRHQSSGNIAESGTCAGAAVVGVAGTSPSPTPISSSPDGASFRPASRGAMLALSVSSEGLAGSLSQPTTQPSTAKQRQKTLPGPMGNLTFPLHTQQTQH